MVALKRSPVIPPPPAWWHGLADILGFSKRQSKTFWGALSASTHPQLVGLRYRCYEHEAFLKGRKLDLLTDAEILHRFLKATWSPHVMVMSLERLHHERLLTRQECSVFEEKFLARTDRFGGWTPRPRP